MDQETHCEWCKDNETLALQYIRANNETTQRWLAAAREADELRDKVRNLKGWLIGVCIGVVGSAVYRGIVGALS